MQRAEAQLIEALNATGAVSTAKYEGIGSFTKLKPRVYASYRKENESVVFDWLRGKGREDLIKPSVHSQSLSALVAELLEKGDPIPQAGEEPLITYYSAESLRFNPKGA